MIKLGQLDPKVAAVYTDAALTPYLGVKSAPPFLHARWTNTSCRGRALGQFGIKLLRFITGCPIIAVDVEASKLRPRS